MRMPFARPGMVMLLCAFALLAFAIALFAADDAPTPALTYPHAKTVNQIDDYHGVKVPDPYRWLEDTDSPETREWIEAENKLTFQYLEQIPYRQAIHDRLKTLWNYERFSVPEQQGGRYFYQHNTGLQNQSVLLVADSLSAEPRLLLDPNTLSADGTVALTSTSISHDGNLVAYGLAKAGSDWEDFKVRDVRTGQDLPDEIHWVKFSGASWTKNNDGFYYSRF